MTEKEESEERFDLEAEALAEKKVLMGSKLGNELAKTLIPNLQIDAKNRIIEQTKEIPLNINGKEVLIKIRKLDTGTRNRIRSECSKTTILGGVPQIKVDETEIQEKMLSKAIVDAPFEFTVAALKLLTCDVTDYLFYEYNEFAEPTDKKKVELEKD